MPFGERSRRDRDASGNDFSNLKPEIGQVMAAVWQIVTTGSDQQRRDAIGILVETRRKLYGLLADGDESPDDFDGPDATGIDPMAEGEEDDYRGTDGGER